MPHKNLEDMSFLTKISFLVIAVIAGIVHWGKRDLTNTKMWEKIMLLLYDITVSGSIAIFAGLIVVGQTENEVLGLGIGGIAGHLGTKLIHFAELYISKKIKKN